MSQAWTAKVSPYAKAHDGRALFELTLTLGLYGACWWAMFRLLDHSALAALALAPVAGLFLMRIFVIQHDCGHGSFFSVNRVNHVVGSLLGVLTLTPYAYWRRTHSIHHATSGNLDRREYGDIETLTVAEYRALSPWRKFVYRVYRNPLFFLLVGPFAQFVVKHRLPTDAPLSWKKEWASVIGTNLALAAAVIGLGETIGYGRFLMIQVPIVAVAGPLGIWLFFVQHQYEGAYWRRDADWSFQDAARRGSSYYDLPAVLHWVTGHIGLHHVHHLDSRVPLYRLKACMDAVPELSECKKLGLLESLSCPRFKLWDEDRRMLVGFEAAEAAAS